MRRQLGHVRRFRRYTVRPQLWWRVTTGVHIFRWFPTGRLVLGDGVVLHRGVRIHLETADARVEIGANSYVNHRSEIRCRERVVIGKNCALSWDVRIADSDYHVVGDTTAATRPVVIGDHVWIGFGASVLKGVSVGDGAVIAAGAVVVRDVPSGSMVAGVPARVVREGVTWTP